MIHGSSPRFRAPWRAWRVVPLAAPAPPSDRGVLRLRLGHCAGPAAKTPAERMEAIDRRRRAGDPVATSGDLRSSLVPVVLVDGEPVATGWGAVDLPLAPGRHLVEVQSQHSRAWRAVDIAAGKRTRIDYIGLLGEHHRRYGTGEARGHLADYSGYAIGPRGRLRFRQYLPALARSRRSFMLVLLSLPAAALLSWLLDAIGVAHGLLLGVSVWLIALAAWGVRVLWTHLRYNRLGPEAPLEVRADPGVLAPMVLDHEGAPPDPRPGTAAILIDARFIKADLSSEELALQLPAGRGIDRRRRRALDTTGELVPVRHRFAVPPPDLRLDGTPVAASWTRMWIEVPPGRHRLDVRTPRAPMPVPRGEAEPESAAIAFDLPAGETAALDLRIGVTGVPDPEQAVLHGWSCRIERIAEPGAEAPVAPPKVDVRGAVRRAATGRWWEVLDS